MRFLIPVSLLALAAWASPAAAQTPEWTFSYRGMAGASARVHLPLGPVSFLVDAGVGVYVEPVGAQQRPDRSRRQDFLRPHVKLGFDHRLATTPRLGEWSIGPRLIGALLVPLGDYDTGRELAAQVMVRHRFPSDRLLIELAGGLGVHAFTHLPDGSAFESDHFIAPLPAFELRLGRRPAPP